jgi:DNA-binding transcriptional regulator YdaS (Cro superfamily)
MSAHRFRECLDIIGWQNRPLARRLGVDEKQIRRWARGDIAPPPRLMSWMERMARHIANNPPPNVRQPERAKSLNELKEEMRAVARGRI